MNEKMLEILVCPICKGRLIYDKNKQELICNFDCLAYPIKNGIPVMIIEKSRKIKEVEAK